jgi:hypothetical protein
MAGLVQCPSCNWKVADNVVVAGVPLCTHCGASLAGAPSSPATKPSSVPAKNTSANKGTIGGVVLLVIVVAIIWSAVSGGSGGSGGGNVTGRYDGWVPVDSAHGYALITVTNSGSSDAHAGCTVEVRTSFGDYGFDYLDQDIPPGTHNYRVPLTVQNNAARLVVSGSVKDC